jgi:HSP20 family protein
MNNATLTTTHDTQTQLKSAFQERSSTHPAKNPQSYRAPVDVYEAKDRFIVLADMPGTTSDDIELVIDGNMLEITGLVTDRYATLGKGLRQEYGIGDYHRHFRIGSGINADEISAVYRDGILNVNLPKQMPIQPRTVHVDDRS